MKKISIIFTFFVIIMCLFFLPEVYAYTINFDTERHKAANDTTTLGKEGCIRVVVAQGDKKISPWNKNKTNANCYSESWTYNCSNYTFTAEEEIEVFIYTEEDSAHGEKGSVTVSSGDYKISGAVDGKGYDDGGTKDISHYAFLFKIKLKEDFVGGEATKTAKFWIQDQSGGNSKVGFSLTITFKVKSEAEINYDPDLEPKYKEWMELAKNKLGSDDVLVVVYQGTYEETFIIDKRNANNGEKVHSISIDDYIFNSNEKLYVFVCTKDGIKGKDNSFTFNMTDSKAELDEDGWHRGWYSGDTHYLDCIYHVENIESGKHENSRFTFRHISNKIGFYIDLTYYAYATSGKLEYPFDFEESCIELEQRCDSTDFAIQIGSGNKKIMDTIYKGKKNIKEINVDASRVNIKEGKALQIIAYYERFNMKNTGYSFTVRSNFDYSVFEILSIQCKPGHKGYDSCAGELKLLIKKSVGSITIPLHMSVYVGSNKVEFDINIKVNVVEDDTRGNADFEDVLTNTDFYTPIGGSSAGIDKLETKVSVVLTVITNIGIVLCVLVSAILGIKYMLASVEEKAEIKQGLLPYVIGVSLLFGICVFVKILQAVGTSFNT